MTTQEAISKALKLLKLAQRPGTPEEGAAAATAAQRIIDEHKLDVTGMDYEQNQQSEDNELIKDFGFDDPIDRIEPGGYKERYLVRLASVIARHNQCRIVQAAWGKRNAGRIIKVVGRASDVQLVRYLYSFFKFQIDQLRDENCIGHSTAYRGQYCAGCIDTLSARLYTDREKTFKAKREEFSTNSMALVRVNSAIARLEKKALDVDKFIKENMNIWTARGGFSRVETGGRAQGQQDGHKIRLTSSRGSLGSGIKQLN